MSRKLWNYLAKMFKKLTQSYYHFFTLEKIFAVRNKFLEKCGILL